MGPEHCYLGSLPPHLISHRIWWIPISAPRRPLQLPSLHLFSPVLSIHAPHGVMAPENKNAPKPQPSPDENPTAVVSSCSQKKSWLLKMATRPNGIYPMADALAVSTCSFSAQTPLLSPTPGPLHMLFPLPATLTPLHTHPEFSDASSCWESFVTPQAGSITIYAGSRIPGPRTPGRHYLWMDCLPHDLGVPRRQDPECLGHHCVPSTALPSTGLGTEMIFMEYLLKT